MKRLQFVEQKLIPCYHTATMNCFWTDLQQIFYQNNYSKHSIWIMWCLITKSDSILIVKTCYLCFIRYIKVGYRQYVICWKLIVYWLLLTNCHDWKFFLGKILIWIVQNWYVSLLPYFIPWWYRFLIWRSTTGTFFFSTL